MMNMILRLYYNAVDWSQRGDHIKAERAAKLLDSLAVLGQSHLTDLQLLRIAADCGFTPFHSLDHWRSSTTPPFTVFRDDIGCVVGETYGNKEWDVLERCNNAFSDTYVSHTLPVTALAVIQHSL